MKKSIITLVAVLISAIAFAQDASQTVIPDYNYAELVGYARLLSNKVTVEIDYGQAKAFLSDQRIVDEETGRVKKFNSMIDALNYMGELGWEFVQAYTVTTGNQNTYHWLLKRKLSDEDKKKYIPVTKRSLKED